VRLLEQLEQVCRTKHYSPKTHLAYASWVRQFLLFHRDRAGAWVHPEDLGESHVEAFLTHVAVDRKLSENSQNQALNAIVFLYRHVVRKDLGTFDAVRAARPRRVPTVLSVQDVSRLLDAMRHGSTHRLMAEVLYGCGLRLMECCTIRVMDLDFDRGSIMVRAGKGKKDRATVFPRALRGSLAEYIEHARLRHERDCRRGDEHGWVSVPASVEHKRPLAGREFRYQFLFGSTRVRFDDSKGRWLRWHAHPIALDRSVKEAADLARIRKRVTCHVLRQSFATHLLESGCDIRTVQTLLGHKHLGTTMLYSHVMQQRGVGVRSPRWMRWQFRLERRLAQV